MKKYLLFLVPFIFVGCDEDLPNQFTSVKGHVTDYYTHLPVADISLIVREKELFGFGITDINLDTLISDINGYYYCEFYNDSDRYYLIEPLISENYYSSGEVTIEEGASSIIDFSLKPFNTLYIHCVKNNFFFNKVQVYNFQTNRYTYYNLSGSDTIMQSEIIPEDENEFSTVFFHYNNDGVVDSSKLEELKFYSGKKDTTITYYY
jgi:hypothetical protein